ncbi:hypothetical protein HN011_007920 [Eciton burchellii]|nr:hypothetical protein HN011_007920 [Eciton burchellii]
MSEPRSKRDDCIPDRRRYREDGIVRLYKSRSCRYRYSGASKSSTSTETEFNLVNGLIPTSGVSTCTSIKVNKENRDGRSREETLNKEKDRIGRASDA